MDKKFVLRDSKGHVRATIQMDNQDNVSFSLKSADSVDQLVAAVHADGTTIFTIFDQTHSGAINMVAGGPKNLAQIDLRPEMRVILHDYHFSPMATLGMSTNNVPYLELMRPQGRVRLTVGMSDTTTPCLEFLGWQNPHRLPVREDGKEPASSNTAVEPTRAPEGARGSP